MDLTPIRNIDTVLKTFHEQGKNGLEMEQAQSLSKVLDDEEFKRILLKLLYDKFIILDGDRYVITFDGVISHLSNGYEGKIRRDNKFTETIYRQTVMAKRMFWITVAIGISTAVAAIYYLVELYWRYHWFRGGR